MSQSAALAEVKFPQYAINLYGRVEQMDQASVRIRLDTAPTGEHVLRVGNEAQLMVVAKGVIYRANVQVEESAAPRVTMKFSAPPKSVQRRNLSRRACDFPTALRLRSEEGCSGAWQEARATNISAQGMRVTCERRTGIAGEVELRFCLEDGSVGAFLCHVASEGAQESHSVVEAATVKVVARVVHKTALPDGQLAVGLSFRKLSACDQLRLMRYAEAALVTQML